MAICSKGHLDDRRRTPFRHLPDARYYIPIYFLLKCENYVHNFKKYNKKGKKEEDAISQASCWCNMARVSFVISCRLQHYLSWQCFIVVLRENCAVTGTIQFTFHLVQANYNQCYYLLLRSLRTVRLYSIGINTVCILYTVQNIFTITNATCLFLFFATNAIMFKIRENLHRNGSL